MTQTTQPAYDVIGVGFGPSNIALAIALEEITSNQPMNCLFIDKQAHYKWHGETITGQSGLQISFLKDLVTLRDPTSPYSFLNYLRSHNRLVDFTNLGSFYPSRLEFNDYLTWVAGHFGHQCQYGEEITSVEPVLDGHQVKALKVISQEANGSQKARIAKSLVVSTGGSPFIPDTFQAIQHHTGIFHHSSYLSQMAQQVPDKTAELRIAIIGGGQSAAEAFIDINDNYPNAKVDLIMRGNAIKPADASPFVNEIFNPSATDQMFGKPLHERESLLQEYKYANYTAVDAAMIDQIYNIFYMQKVSRSVRHQYRPNSDVVTASESGNRIELKVRDNNAKLEMSSQYDLVILATGYQRQKMTNMLKPIQQYLGNMEVGRNYQLKTTPDFAPPVFIQGASESTHGLSDTLLSVLAIRSEEISHALKQALLDQSRTKQADAALA